MSNRRSIIKRGKIRRNRQLSAGGIHFVPSGVTAHECDITIHASLQSPTMANIGSNGYVLGLDLASGDLTSYTVHGDRRVFSFYTSRP